ncbi:MAG: alpha/beta fold hydrolase [Leptospira sp.]|nr:alpha/beta fold hydrolase [Leptospira sp.]
MNLNYKFYKSQNNTQSDSSSHSNNDSKSDPRPLIILHGLFGSSRNWVSIAKSLSKNRDVYALDLRNHGDSPWHDTHSLEDMVEDLREFIEARNLDHPILLGHSMGGLVTMLYALKAEKNEFPPVARIIIQDIAPREYPFDYDKEVESMQLDLSECTSRSDVDEKMKLLVPDPFIRQFLQMNLERKETGGYEWKLNVETIAHSRKMFGNLFRDLDSANISALFLLGGDSGFIQEGDEELIRGFFPKATIHTIPGGNHYIQYTHADEFLHQVDSFLNSQLD